MNAYEMTFIIRPDLDEDGSREVVETVTGRVGSAGGEVLATVPWNPPRRRMAYSIRDFGDGFYVTTVFRLDPQALRPIENALKLNDRILRFLIVQATERNIREAQQRVQQAATRPAPAPETTSAAESATTSESAAPSESMSPAESTPPSESVSPAEAAPTAEAAPLPTTPAPETNEAPAEEPTTVATAAPPTPDTDAPEAAAPNPATEAEAETVPVEAQTAGVQE